MVKHIYSAEAALTGTDRVGLIVKIIRGNNKSQQMSRSLHVTAPAKKETRSSLWGTGCVINDSCGVMSDVIFRREVQETLQRTELEAVVLVRLHDSGVL